MPESNTPVFDAVTLASLARRKELTVRPDGVPAEEPALPVAQ
jgi:hypothetical protein